MSEDIGANHGRPVYVKGYQHAIVFEVVIPAGRGTRRIEVPVDPDAILRLATAIKKCQHGTTGTHAVWHFERPDREACS